MSTINLKDQTDIFKAAPTPDRLKKNVRVAIITTDNTQDLEFFYPYYRLCEEGYDVDVLTPKGEAFKGKHGMGLKKTMPIDKAMPEDYALIYIPGGKAPEALRKDEDVLAFVRVFAGLQRPVAAICHGIQLLISAELVAGKRMACWPEVKNELEEEGGTFVDEALVEDGQYITARQPGDLPRHLWGVLDYLRDDKGLKKPVRASAG